MLITLALIGGLIVGALIGWLIAGSRAARDRARADSLEEMRKQAAIDFDRTREKLSVAEKAESDVRARLEETNKRLEEQKALLADIQKQFSDAFDALSAKALKSNSESFFQIAEEKFKNLQKSAQSELDARKTAVETLVKPLSEALSKYQQQSQELEKKRAEEMGGVAEQLRALSLTNETLRDETGKLVNALKAPQVRGRWGEMQLRRAAEIAGMSQYCDFVEQLSTDTEEGRLRPDMVVKLPAGREVVVDAKTPLMAYIEAFESADDTTRTTALERHATHVKTHIDQLASKKYWQQFGEGLDLVIMYIPNDSFLAAAADKRPDIIEYAAGKNVMITTPTTFIALLKAIALGWREAQLAENAKQISQLAQDLYDRITTMSSHLTDLGRALQNSVDRFNKTVGSFDTRLLPAARKFVELGIHDSKELESPPVIDLAPREPNLLSVSNTDDYK